MMNCTQMTDAEPDVRGLRSAALKWYDKHGRRLPWRSGADPFRVWLSEIMLQQTTVAAVIPYFERFTAAFPTVGALAAADLQQVLRLWEGLGYYSRARNLHKAAQEVVQRFDGVIPSDLDALQSLPGIGRYSAGAIRSFAFDLAAPILEANTERLYARLTGLTDEIRSSTSRTRLWQFAESLASNRRSGDLNQALMDLGSQVCRHVQPLCAECPVRRYCQAFAQGRQNEIPVKSRPAAVTQLIEICIVLRHRGRFRIRQRSGDERWAGMWDFPRFEVDEHFAKQFRRALPESRTRGRKLAADSPLEMPHTRSLFERPLESLPVELTGLVHDRLGLQLGRLLDSFSLSYSVTRYRVEVLCLVCDGTDEARSSASRRWSSPAELQRLPLPQNSRRMANRIGVR